MTKKLLILILMAISFSGCDRNKVYEADISFEEKTWDMNKIPAFSFELEHTKTVDIFFKMRNDLDYPFQNLYVQYTFRKQKGNELKKDLVNLSLFNAKTGVPLGKGSSVFQNRAILLTSQTLAAGSYEVELAQYMRNEALNGVYSIGIRVEESEATEK